MNKDLTVGKPAAVLWKYALPLLGGVLFQQLYSIADSFVAGKFISDHALAAVGNAYEVTLIYFAVAFGCNMGTSIVTSSLFGAKRMSELKTEISTSFCASALVCAALMLAGFFAMQPLLALINTPREILADSMLYLQIYTAGLPFVFFYNIATGVFAALGDSKTPFYFLAASSVANIAMDIWFVRGLAMGVAGVAWATFLCQGASCVVSLVVLARRIRAIHCGRSPFFSAALLKKTLAIGIPSMLQQIFVSVGNIAVQSVVNSFGPVVIAGYSAGIKLNNFAVTSFVTVGNGISNYTAQNMGAGETRRLRQGYRAGVLMILCVALPFILCYQLLPGSLVGLFLQDAGSGALRVGTELLRIISPFYCVVVLKLVADGVLRGSGKMAPFMLTTFVDLALRVAFAFILSPLLGKTGIWLAWPLGWSVSAALSTVFYARGVWLPAQTKTSKTDRI